LQDQNSTWYHYPCLQIQGRRHCCSWLSSNSRKLCWSVDVHFPISLCDELFCSLWHR
jgi:hypothetical protein